MNYEAIEDATSSQESQAGQRRYVLPNGQMLFPFGQVLARVSHSVQRVNKKVPRTSDTSGQSSAGSLTSAVLQSSLESRLRANLEGAGSPVYALTWKHWDMQSGPAICALRASGRRTSDNGCTGWPTATVNDAKSGRNRTAKRSNKESNHHDGLTLCDAVELAGWRTPEASNGEQGAKEPKGDNPRVTLTDQVTGWATPQARDYFPAHSAEYIAEKKAQGHGMANLNDQVSGLTSNGLPAPTEKRGQLNPAFSCWLMGYPDVWLSCVDWVTLSSRKSRRRL